MCAGVCPVAGIDGFDPRKIIRLVTLGLEEELVASRWPWICTLCARCEYLYPMPIDKKGANLLTTVHNKLVNTHTEDLKHWWKIFFAAGEDWTVASDAWEGVNWGYFTGDDAAMKVMVDRIAQQLEALEIRHLMWPE